LGLGLGIKLGLAFFKDLCDKNALTLVGKLAIREATAKVESRGCHHSESRSVLQGVPFAMAAHRYSGPKPSFIHSNVPSLTIHPHSEHTAPQAF